MPEDAGPAHRARPAVEVRDLRGGEALPTRSLTPASLLERGNLPRHIAIIMDGNGRWAKARGVPRLMGHRAGREAVREAVKGCVALGIQVLTLYTFSIENWNRPRREVQALMAHPEAHAARGARRAEAPERPSGRDRAHRRSPAPVREVIDESRRELEGCTGLLLNLALSYSGRAELVDAIAPDPGGRGRAEAPRAMAWTRRWSRATSRPPGCRIPTC